MSLPRVVLFDLGNVLVYLRLERFWDTLHEPDAERRQRIGHDLREMGKVYEGGRMTTDEFRHEALKIVGSRKAADIERAFLGVLPEPVEGMEELVRKVAEQASTALVSNTNPLHFDHCLRTAPSLRHLRRFYLSYELKALKPDPAFYEGVVRGERLESSSMLFIDDLPENIEGARRAGVQGIVFRGIKELTEDLRSAGFEV
ncbi:MAG: HAD family phosphatase [Bacteroidetes bacterium]|jgi:putative hydrolase of the HAD superfamily|nr:HAD family phosphatase [Bacteroidota bacterium]